jgi:two-component system, chemotaxis family, response regulator PixG
MYSNLMIPNYLIGEFKSCTQIQYNGSLNIKSSKGIIWKFYYRLGRIVWASGGIHPFRRWRRQMAQYCPDFDVNKIQLGTESIAALHWDYQLLENLHKQNVIKREQIINITENVIAELLFDLAQQSNYDSMSCERSQAIILEEPMSLSRTDLSLRYVSDSWNSWAEAGLASFSPNLAPVLRKPEQLQQMLSTAAYNNFAKLMSGKYTLRDLSLRMKQDLLSVSRSLLPYVLKGIIELIEVNDLPLKFIPDKKSSIKTPKSETKLPLIACVDDSSQVCQIVKQIITSNNMNFIGVQNPVNILPTLIEQKPDLIFLDLIMPITSGYEICSQLRRVSAFANTPVIILTGNDGLFDRVRAKVVGSTDFMVKPVVADKVMAMVQKYLTHSQKDVLAVSESNLKLSYS